MTENYLDNEHMVRHQRLPIAGDSSDGISGFKISREKSIVHSNHPIIQEDVQFVKEQLAKRDGEKHDDGQCAPCQPELTRPQLTRHSKMEYIEELLSGRNPRFEQLLEDYNFRKEQNYDILDVTESTCPKTSNVQNSVLPAKTNYIE